MDDKDRDEAKKLCKRLDWMKINGKNDLVQWENVLSYEIARIRAEACADERRRCTEELDARAGWKQHIETIIKLINSEVDCVQTKNGAYVNLDGVLGCLKYSG